MEINKIILNFKNLDEIIIDKKDIRTFYINNAKYKKMKIYKGYCHRLMTESFVLQINKDGNYIPDKKFRIIDKEISAFDRIQAKKDIDNIKAIFIDEEMGELEYSFWFDIIDEININEKLYMADNGNLCIVISDNKNIEDFFDTTKIDENDDVLFMMKYNNTYY